MKLIIYTLTLLAVGIIAKYILSDVYIRLTANDEIDAPCDYDRCSQADLNGVHKFNVGGK